MIPVTFDDTLKSLEVDFINPSTYPGINPKSLLVKLFELCQKLDDAVSLQKIDFFCPDPLFDQVYEYKVKTKDNRNWNQIITFLEWPDTDPFMTINTNQDQWKPSELTLHRPVRDEIINLRAHATLNRFKIVYA